LKVAPSQRRSDQTLSSRSDLANGEFSRHEKPSLSKKLAGAREFPPYYSPCTQPRRYYARVAIMLTIRGDIYIYIYIYIYISLRYPQALTREYAWYSRAARTPESDQYLFSNFSSRFQPLYPSALPAPARVRRRPIQSPLPSPSPLLAEEVSDNEKSPTNAGLSLRRNSRGN